MVRTVADGAFRVAAGGKAPSKKGGSSYSPRSSSPTEKLGKDNLPVNKYFPRDTPAWQKKITFFINLKSGEPIKAEDASSVVEVPKKANGSETRRSKRSSSVLDESNEMNTEESSTKKFKSNVLMEDDSEQNGQGVNGSMEMDE